MQPKIPKLLEDMRDAAAFIVEVTRDVDENGYVSNRICTRALSIPLKLLAKQCIAFLSKTPLQQQRPPVNERVEATKPRWGYSIFNYYALLSPLLSFCLGNARTVAAYYSA